MPLDNRHIRIEEAMRRLVFECMELEVRFKMGHCTGICNGVEKKVSPSDMDFATEAKRTP